MSAAQSGTAGRGERWDDLVTMQFEIEESFKIKIELMIDRDLRELFGSGKNEATENGAGREEQSGKHNI